MFSICQCSDFLSCLSGRSMLWVRCKRNLRDTRKLLPLLKHRLPEKTSSLLVLPLAWRNRWTDSLSLSLSLSLTHTHTAFSNFSSQKSRVELQKSFSTWKIQHHDDQREVYITLLNVTYVTLKFESKVSHAVCTIFLYIYIHI